MPIFEIQAPDGKTYQIEGPNEEGAIDALQQHLRATGTPSGEAPSTAGTGAPASTPSSPPAPAPEGGQEMGVMGQAAQWLMGGPPEIRKQKVEEWAKKAQRFNSGGPSGAENMLQAITFNRLDDAARLVGADDFANRVNENQTQFRENHPLLSTAYEIGGSMIPMALGGMAIPRLAGMATAKIPMAAQMMTQGGKVAQALPAVVREGAKYGGLGAATSAAYSSGEEGNTAGDVLSDTLWGGALGGAMGMAGQGLNKAIAIRKATKARTRSSDRIEALRRPYYDKMKEATLKPQIADNILSQLEDVQIKSAGQGYVRMAARDADHAAHPYTRKFIEVIRGNKSNIIAAQPGMQTSRSVNYRTLEDLQELTQQADKFIGMAEGNDRDMLVAMKDQLKAFMKGLKDDSFLTKGGKDAVAGMKRAWTLDKRKKKVEIFEKIVRDARNQKGQFGIDADLVQQRLNRLVDTGNKDGMFTQKEWQLIQRAAKGGSMRTIFSTLAKISPDSMRGLLANTALGTVTNAGLAAGIATSGAAGKLVHKSMMKGEMQELMRAVSTGVSRQNMANKYKPRKWPTGAAIATGGQVGNE